MAAPTSVRSRSSWQVAKRTKSCPHLCHSPRKVRLLPCHIPWSLVGRQGQTAAALATHVSVAGSNEKTQQPHPRMPFLKKESSPVRARAHTHTHTHAHIHTRKHTHAYVTFYTPCFSQAWGRGRRPCRRGGRPATQSNATTIQCMYAPITMPLPLPHHLYWCTFVINRL